MSLKLMSLLTWRFAYTVFPYAIESNFPCFYKNWGRIVGPGSAGAVFSKKPEYFDCQNTFVIFRRKEGKSGIKAH